MDIRVIDSNPLYQGEVYRLKFNFSQSYPIEVRYPHYPSLPISYLHPSPTYAR